MATDDDDEDITEINRKNLHLLVYLPITLVARLPYPYNHPLQLNLFL